jgi:hypothetical protein
VVELNVVKLPSACYSTMMQRKDMQPSEAEAGRMDVGLTVKIRLMESTGCIWFVFGKSEEIGVVNIGKRRRHGCCDQNASLQTLT